MNALPKLGTPTANGYRISKGYTLKGDKLVQKFFWLGRDPLKAVAKSLAVEEIAESIPKQQDGKLVWENASLLEVEAAFAAIEKPTAPAATPPQLERPSAPPMPISVPVFPPQAFPAGPNPATIRLHEALDEYVVSVAAKNEIGRKTKTMTEQRVRSLKFHIPNVQLATVQYEQLRGFRNVITARPECRRQQSSKKPKKEIPPISIMTTRNWLATLGQAFRWFKKTNRWTLPAGTDFDDIREVFFLSKAERSRLCVDREERQKLNKPKPCPTLDELCIYYRLASNGQRMLMLMGICLGWRQAQIADLRKQDLLQRGNEYFVRFERTKTGVEGDLWLCPELAKCLIEKMSNTPDTPANYALLTAKGNPKVHISQRGNDTDAIGLSWDCLRRAAIKASGVSLPFDSLRRFAGQAVSNLGDPFLAQVFLAQVPESVLEQHYAGRGIGIGIGQTAFERVHDVQRKVYADLKPMFDAANRPMGELLENMRKGKQRASAKADVPESNAA